jgi:hypothetical protein
MAANRVPASPFAKTWDIHTLHSLDQLVTASVQRYGCDIQASLTSGGSLDTSFLPQLLIQLHLLIFHRLARQKGAVK